MTNDLSKEEAAGEAGGEMNGVLTHDTIREVDILAGRYNGAKIIHYIIDLDRPWMWYRKHVWWIKSIDLQAGRFQADVVGVEKYLTLPIGQNYEKECGVVFGGPKCNALPITFVNETVSQVPSTSGGTLGFSGRDNRAFRIEEPGAGYPLSAAGQPPVWEFGVVEFNSGNNSGLKSRIAHVEFEGGVNQTGYMIITLSLPMPFPIRVGDSTIITSGCDGTLETCRNIYNNAINFRGQPEMPDTRETYRGPEQDDNYQPI